MPIKMKSAILYMSSFYIFIFVSTNVSAVKIPGLIKRTSDDYSDVQNDRINNDAILSLGKSNLLHNNEPINIEDDRSKRKGNPKDINDEYDDDDDDDDNGNNANNTTGIKDYIIDTLKKDLMFDGYIGMNAVTQVYKHFKPDKKTAGKICKGVPDMNKCLIVTKIYLNKCFKNNNDCYKLDLESCNIPETNEKLYFPEPYSMRAAFMTYDMAFDYLYDNGQKYGRMYNMGSSLIGGIRGLLYFAQNKYKYFVQQLFSESYQLPRDKSITYIEDYVQKVIAAFYMYTNRFPRIAMMLNNSPFVRKVAMFFLKRAYIRSLRQEKVSNVSVVLPILTKLRMILFEKHTLYIANPKLKNLANDYGIAAIDSLRKFSNARLYTSAGKYSKSVDGLGLNPNIGNTRALEKSKIENLDDEEIPIKQDMRDAPNVNNNKRNGSQIALLASNQSRSSSPTNDNNSKGVENVKNNEPEEEFDIKGSDNIAADDALNELEDDIKLRKIKQTDLENKTNNGINETVSDMLYD